MMGISSKTLVHALALGGIISLLAVPSGPAVAAARATTFTSAASMVSERADIPFAGYVTNKGKVTQGTATFKVPAVSCAGDTRAVAFGVLGNGAAAGLFVICNPGSPQYVLDVTAGKKNKQNNDVAVGDTISVSFVQSANKVTAKVTNKTQKVTITIAGKPKKDKMLLFGASPVFLNEQMLAVPKFQPVTLSKNKINKKPLTTNNSQKVDRIDFGNIVIMTGPLNNAKFTLTANVP